MEMGTGGERNVMPDDIPSKEEIASSLNDAARIRALKVTEVLDADPEEFFDRQTRILQRILDVPTALVSIVDTDRQFFLSAQGLGQPWCELRQTPLGYSFCQYVVARQKPLIVEDARDLEFLKDNLGFTELNVIAYAGFPITISDEGYLGSVCVVDQQPRKWSPLELELIEDIADLVSKELVLRLELKTSQQMQRTLNHAIDEIREANLALTSANQRLEQFSNTIAHDLRGPITALLMTLELIQAEKMDDEFLNEMLDDSITSIRKSNDILNDLLALAKSGAGKLQVEEIDVDQLVGEVVADSPTLAQPGCRLDFESLGTVEGYKTLVWLIFKNLLENAAKYCSKEKDTHITVRREGPVFSISDNGPGIASEYQENVFDLFNRAGAKCRTGTGLGLHICKQAVSEHKGKIWLESELDRGCTFFFTLQES